MVGGRGGGTKATWDGCGSAGGGYRWAAAGDRGQARRQRGGDHLGSSAGWLLHARLFSRWVAVDEQAAPATIDRMLAQRVQLGLAAPGLRGPRTPVRVVPVLAIGAGPGSATALERLWVIAAALHGWLQEDPRVRPAGGGGWMLLASPRSCTSGDRSC